MVTENNLISQAESTIVRDLVASEKETVQEESNLFDRWPLENRYLKMKNYIQYKWNQS